MKPFKIFVLAFLICVFILGFLTCLHPKVERESMTNMLSGEPSYRPNVSEDNVVCPNILIRSGNRLVLQNTNSPVTERNPIYFNSLDEYSEHIKKQREVGIRCPVLFLQEETNTQGQNVFRVRPSPFDMNGAIPSTNAVLSTQDTESIRVAVQRLDASRQNGPFNKNHYAGFDPYGQHIGQYTDLDKIHDSTTEQRISDNPMDPNWGGVLYSQSSVDSGKYIGNEVRRPEMIPKVFEIYK